MRCIKGLFLFLFLSAMTLQAQQSQPILSLITISPGTNIYSAFGHTALRYQDQQNGIDYFYSFGTFDFQDPQFVPKFVHGRLDYFLDVASFESELSYYATEEDRTVVEQKLNLKPEEIEQIYTFLTWNAQPENRYYKYDFIKDNCSTRIMNVLNSTMENSIIYPQPTIAKIAEKSYRDYIRHYLKTSPWYDAGIQLALGCTLDWPVLLSDSFFLPDIVQEIIANSTLTDGSPLVSSTEVLYRSSADPINDPINDLLNDPIYFKPPFLIFAFLLAVELFLLLLSGIKKRGWITKTLGSYEYLLVLVNFLFGALLFFLWFISDHTAAKWNLNILWCTPLSLFYLLTFFLKGAGQIVFKWVSLFLTFTSFMFLLVLVAGLQTTAISLIPLLVLYIIIFGRRIFILS